MTACNPIKVKPLKDKAKIVLLEEQVLKQEYYKVGMEEAYLKVIELLKDDSSNVERSNSYCDYCGD